MNKPFVLLPALLAVLFGHFTSPELNRSGVRPPPPDTIRTVAIYHRALKASHTAAAPFNATIDPERIRFGIMRVGERKLVKAKLTNISAEPIDVRELALRGTHGFKVLSPVGRFILGPAGNAGATLDVEIEFTATTAGIFTDVLGVDEGNGPCFLAQAEAIVKK